ncbi:MAG: hypothetical protein JO263_09490, partial [Candidatus Eremiobacteraeota bacterium]|nr:hypothetical protein [Candidatus Eremiobacteraeota bacterium]
VGICSGGYHSIFYSAPLVLVFRRRQLEAAARRRRAGLAQDRTVTARARSPLALRQAQGDKARDDKLARDDIVAARRERRAKAKAARTTTPVVAPPRYRKKRTDSTGAVAVEEPFAGDETAIDPLDAQNAGLHEAALEQGHEEISLNLDEFPSTGSGQAAPAEDKPQV